MSLFDTLKNKLTWPIKKIDNSIDQRVSEEVQEKVTLATRTAVTTLFEGLDAVAPAVGDLLSGEKVTLKFTHTIDIEIVQKQ